MLFELLVFAFSRLPHFDLSICYCLLCCYVWVCAWWDWTYSYSYEPIMHSYTHQHTYQYTLLELNEMRDELWAAESMGSWIAELQSQVVALLWEQNSIKKSSILGSFRVEISWDRMYFQKVRENEMWGCDLKSLQHHNSTFHHPIKVLF